VKVAGGTKTWLVNVTAYTVAGALTSAFVGGALGTAGDLVLQPEFRRPAIVAAIAASLTAIAREIGWVSFALPQPKRQTSRMWARSFRGPIAPALWGADLGLTFTTRLTFAGPWVLGIVVLAASNALLGVGVFVAYWVGRALAAWLAAFMLPAADATPQLMDRINEQYRVAQLVHVTALVGIALILSSSIILES
jgi:hypothetical protein